MTSDVIGLVAVSQSGGRGLVLSDNDDRLTLQCPDGIKRVPKSAVVRFECPQAPCLEPDPYPVGTKIMLKPVLPWMPPELWEVVEPANEHKLYLLKSDRGNWAGLSGEIIKRDRKTA